MSFVEVRNIFQSYGPRPIIERVNVDVAEGEFISIVGASGCGKSTFLRLLLAEEQPTRGTIRIDGNPPAREPGRERGVVFQRYSVFPHMTVRDNIVAGESFARRWGRFAGAERRAALQRADETLHRIGLAHVAGAYPATLSGGMQQRLAIGQALQAKPRILLLDEPFGALDQFTREELWQTLQALWLDRGITVLLVTHDLREAAYLASRVCVMSARPGRIIEDRAVAFARPRPIDVTFDPAFVSMVQDLRRQIVHAPAAPAGAVQ